MCIYIYIYIFKGLTKLACPNKGRSKGAITQRRKVVGGNVGGETRGGQRKRAPSSKSPAAPHDRARLSLVCPVVQRRETTDASRSARPPTTGPGKALVRAVRVRRYRRWGSRTRIRLVGRTELDRGSRRRPSCEKRAPGGSSPPRFPVRAPRPPRGRTSTRGTEERYHFSRLRYSVPIAYDASNSLVLSSFTTGNEDVSRHEDARCRFSPLRIRGALSHSIISFYGPRRRERAERRRRHVALITLPAIFPLLPYAFPAFF